MLGTQDRALAQVRPEVVDEHSAGDVIDPGGPPVRPYDSAGYTPAFQMAVMYGVRPDIPGFHFHDKRRRADV